MKDDFLLRLHTSKVNDRVQVPLEDRWTCQWSFVISVNEDSGLKNTHKCSNEWLREKFKIKSTEFCNAYNDRECENKFY